MLSFLFNTYCDWSVLVLRGSFVFCIVKKVLPRVIPCQCLCMLLGHYLWYVLCTIQVSRPSFGMQMMLLFMDIWMIIMSDFLSFVPKVLLLIITLSLLRVFCLLMTDIGLKLKDCSVLWVFRLCTLKFPGWLFGWSSWSCTIRIWQDLVVGHKFVVSYKDYCKGAPSCICCFN